jgi:glycosyltransferase involved in cell wall biosynthesis
MIEASARSVTRAAPLRVAIVTAGRFHVCDLARELDAQGHDVAFYSLVPPSRTGRFGLPPRCNRWLGPYLLPVYAVCRAIRRAGAGAAAQRILYAAVDRVAARVVGPCDVLIGMSQMSAAAMRSARRRFGARTVLERGSRHIASQREILDRIPGAASAAKQVPVWAVSRELAEYQIADLISVPSRHVERSFIERGVVASKLFRNPYGVDLDMFPATTAPPAQASPRIIMVGEWSLRKGCDVLAAAWRRLAPRGVRLVHVGRRGDAPLPTEPGFEHRGTVDQRELTACYAGAHLFALASREEGLALVQVQALASGLPVVATDYTGAEDLREYVDDPQAIAIVPADDVDALARALDTQLDYARGLTSVRDLLRSARDRLSWRAYGARYDAMLRAA